MAKVTKYMQMTNQLLVAYEYNKWESIQEYFNSSSSTASDVNYALSEHCPVLVWQSYTDKDNIRTYHNPMLMDTFLENNKAGVQFNVYLEKNNKYNTGISSTAFANMGGSEYYRAGIFDSYSNAENTSLITVRNYTDMLDNLQTDQSNFAYIKENRIQRYFKDGSGNPVFFGYQTGNQDKLFYNRIRIYILSGYVFNASEGFHLKAKCKQRSKEYNLYGEDHKNNIDEWSTLISYVFQKAELREKVKWLPNPFYMSSRYYDRYIDIWMPDPFYLASKLDKMAMKKVTDVEDMLQRFPERKSNRAACFLDTDPETGETIIDQTAIDLGYVYDINSIETLAALMNLSINTDIVFEFSPILTENYNENIKGWSAHRFSSISLNLESPVSKFEKEATFLPENTASGYIKPISNSDYFNCKILKDPNTGTIYDSPRFGEADPDTGDIPLLTRNVMARINAGVINMYNYGLYDSDYEDIDEFEETYGDNASKWVILNELMVIYYYENTQTYDIIRRSSTYTNTIDYSQDSEEFAFYNSANESDAFGVTSYRPIIKAIDGYYCKTIAFVYNCHLINRMNGAEVIRTASLSVNEPETIYTELPRKINLDNLHTWRVFNKVWAYDDTIDVLPEYTASDFNNLETGTGEPQYIREYYNSADLVIRDGASNYQQGQYKLKIYSSGHNYLFNLMEYKNESNEIIHTSLAPTGCEYILKFTLMNGSTSEFTPTYSSNMDPALGQLEYRLTDGDANQILSNVGNNPTFSIVCRTPSGDSTVYQGIYGPY